jgi:hypothetical protein
VYEAPQEEYDGCCETAWYKGGDATVPSLSAIRGKMIDDLIREAPKESRCIHYSDDVEGRVRGYVQFQGIALDEEVWHVNSCDHERTRDSS